MQRRRGSAGSYTIFALNILRIITIVFSAIVLQFGWAVKYVGVAVGAHEKVAPVVAIGVFTVFLAFTTGR